MSDQTAQAIKEITANPHKHAFPEIVSLLLSSGYYNKDEAEETATVLLSNTKVYA